MTSQPQYSSRMNRPLIVQPAMLSLDTENQAIRKIDTSTGLVSTVTGGGPERRGGAGDGGPATEAQLDRPHGICVAADGTIYIGDTLNHRVRGVK